MILQIFRRTISFATRIMAPPDRWEAYNPIGKVIPGTKFIAFKVPLKEEQLRQVEDKDRFSPTILMKLLDEQGLKLGGVIDLTFTYKYYNSQEFIEQSVGHKKIFVAGHVVPSEEVFQEFAHAVKAFETENHDNVIGVHCTHGVNRTGYLICRYMIEEMDYEPDEAISLFNEARGHDLERENYLEDLKNRKKGQSSFDPNFKPVERVDRRITQTFDDQRPRRDQGPRKDKQRWRNNKSEHQGWQKKHRYGNQDADGGQEATESGFSDRQVGSSWSHDSGGNGWGYGHTQTSYYGNKVLSRDRPQRRGGSQHGRYRGISHRGGNQDRSFHVDYRNRIPHDGYPDRSPLCGNQGKNQDRSYVDYSNRIPHDGYQDRSQLGGNQDESRSVDNRNRASHNGYQDRSPLDGNQDGSRLVDYRGKPPQDTSQFNSKIERFPGDRGRRVHRNNDAHQRGYCDVPRREDNPVRNFQPNEDKSSRYGDEDRSRNSSYIGRKRTTERGHSRSSAHDF